jgi:hypothetical protein
MGYYENPPIINPGRGSEMISAGIMNAANSIAEGLIKRGENKRQEEKERKLTIQKLQDRKNETDLLYNEKLSKWSVKQDKVKTDVDKKIYDITQQKITLAADSKILLLNETDKDKRQEYLSNITNADLFLETSSKFAKSAAGQVATWRLDTKAIKVGKPGGHVVNGSTDEEILDNTAAVEILGGMDSRYTNTNIDVAEDKDGGLLLSISGKHDNGRDFKVEINSKSFDMSEEEGDGGLLIPVESLDTFYTKTKESVMNKKGEIFPGYLNPTMETYDLKSKGSSGGIGADQYQRIESQRIEAGAIKAQIKKESDITATGVLSADSPTRLRALIDYTLEKGVGWYDENFKKINNVEDQKKMLSDLLTEKAFEGMTRDLEKTVEGGVDVWWNPSDKVQIKDKVTAAELKKQNEPDGAKDPDKEPKTNYKTEYYDDIILGNNTYVKKEGESEGQVDYKNRQSLATNLNKLSGEVDGFITREDLFKLYADSPYVSGKFDTGLTMQEAFTKGKIKENLKTSFERDYGSGKIYFKKGEGVYKPVTSYDLKTATGRVKLALDYTSNAGERTILQEKLKEAKLMDWVQKNPKNSNETQEQYAVRARKNN